MPWYRIDVRHGPGHQGLDTTYKWWGHELSPVEEEEERIEASQRDGFWEDPIARIAKVDTIPDDERERQIQKYKRWIRSGRYMLKVLGAEE